MNILILEGPAGSGKTSIIRALKERGRVELLDGGHATIDRPRSYPGQIGIWLSQVKDYFGITQALVKAQQTGRIVALDRWVLSQYVYGTIRRQQPIPQSLFRSAIREVEQAALQLSFRGLAIDSKIHLHLVVLMPSPHVIHRLRARSGRDYPFEVGKELLWYGQAWHELKTLTSPTTYLKLHTYLATPPPSAFDNGEVIRGFDAFTRHIER